MNHRMRLPEAMTWLSHQLDEPRRRLLADAKVTEQVRLALRMVGEVSLEDGWWQVRVVRKALDGCETVEEARAQATRLFGFTSAAPGWWREIPT